MKYRASDPFTNKDDGLKMINSRTNIIRSTIPLRLGIDLNQKLIGTVLQNVINEQSIIIGYSLDELYWNKGIGTLVVSKLISDLAPYKFNSIEAVTHKENIGSIHVLAKNNFLLKSKNGDLHTYQYITT